MANMEKISSNDIQEELTRNKNRSTGSRVLALSGFNRHETVDSSYEKALKQGEKLSGNNSERRIFSYLKRLDQMIEKHGTPIEQKLWRASSNKEALLAGDEATQKLQKESLDKWANYLANENSPFPLWFKVYAWDGMTKMGTYNKERQEYERRNKTTIAPYPEPDAEVLSGVFDLVNRYFGNMERQFFTPEGARRVELEEIVKSGNFAKIFNAVQQDLIPVMKPPERTEDVKGEWREYKMGDEEDIVRASRGTGWCTTSSAVCKNYLLHGTHLPQGGRYRDDGENKSKFYLFHLLNPDTEDYAKNCCASIRLDPDGKVAEISGIEDGQALSDSLVPIVEEKASTLPGFEDFKVRFADKKELIRLDSRVNAGEELSKAEIEFLYEVNRPIETLDSYLARDPRIYELKEKYPLERVLETGLNPDFIVKKLNPKKTAENLALLLEHGANIDKIVQNLDSSYIVENLESILKLGANVNKLTQRLDPSQIDDRIKSILRRNGVSMGTLIVARLKGAAKNAFVEEG